MPFWTASKPLEANVRQQALAWIAWLFAVPVESLNDSQRLGLDLKPAPKSFYRSETIEVLIEDITDLEKALKETVLTGSSEFTVGDFCGLVERSNQVDPVTCRRLLHSWNKHVILDSKAPLRQLIFVIGISAWRSLLRIHWKVFVFEVFRDAFGVFGFDLFSVLVSS